jgi:class 3 adenylate cyclase
MEMNANERGASLPTASWCAADALGKPGGRLGSGANHRRAQAQSQQLVTLNQQLEQRVADQVGEIERLGRLRRFLPPQVADLIVASGTEKQLENHRREITTLFCDLRGFTGFSESSRPRRGDGVRERAVMSADAPKLPLPVQ